MNALARREHTLQELKNKLSSRFPLHKNTIPLVLQQLADEDLQSDCRFAQSYIRWRAAKGYGAKRIVLELVQKGVDEELVENTMHNCGIDWQQLLFEQFDKKYDAQIPVTLEDKAKIHRFFQYRGFSAEHIKSVFKTL